MEGSKAQRRESKRDVPPRDSEQGWLVYFGEIAKYPELDEGRNVFLSHERHGNHHYRVWRNLKYGS